MTTPVLATSNKYESLGQPSDLFRPNAEDLATFGSYVLANPVLLPKPQDVPADYIAYNPSAIWTIGGDDVMYERVEPNHSSPGSSHLGKAFVRPYKVDLNHLDLPLEAYRKARDIPGEDPALTRVNRRSANGKLEAIWLLSVVDAQPMADKQNEVKTLRTRFYAGTTLENLEHIADGPEWMKDIRIAQADGPLGTELEVYGRPQQFAASGNITHTTMASISDLTPETIAAAPFIDKKLLPIGSGVWGGVNDVVRISSGKYVLAAHRAWRTGPEGRGRHYESVLYGHDVRTNRIVELGIVATADKFPAGIVKDDTAVDLSDVVFTGGGYNGKLDFMTFGVGDGETGIASLSHIQEPKAA